MKPVSSWGGRLGVKVYVSSYSRASTRVHRYSRSVSVVRDPLAGLCVNLVFLAKG